MSREEQGVDESTKEPTSSKSQQQQPPPQHQLQPQQATDTHSITPQSSSQEQGSPDSIEQKPIHPKETRPPDQSTSDTTYPSTPENAARPKQVIAVNASKGPAAFFNLARKFLVVDEVCDLSALEGAIVSAADAAHLLERSQLATIVRYVRTTSSKKDELFNLTCVFCRILSQNPNIVRHGGAKA